MLVLAPITAPKASANTRIAQFGAGLIDKVDGLVGQKAFGDIPIR
jgi:hypothetical protein